MIKTIGAHRLWLDLLLPQLFRSTSSKGTLRGARITSQSSRWISLVSFSGSFRASIPPKHWALQSRREEWRQKNTFEFDRGSAGINTKTEYGSLMSLFPPIGSSPGRLPWLRCIESSHPFLSRQSATGKSASGGRKAPLLDPSLCRENMTMASNWEACGGCDFS